MRLISREYNFKITEEDLAEWIKDYYGIEVKEFTMIDSGGGDYIAVSVIGNVHTEQSQALLPKGDSGEEADTCRCKRTEPITCGDCGKPLDMKVSEPEPSRRSEEVERSEGS